MRALSCYAKPLSPPDINIANIRAPDLIRLLHNQILGALQVGLDPNIWFKNVELAAAKRIGRETVQYVSNIYKYYIAYRLISGKMELKSNIQRGTK